MTKTFTYAEHSQTRKYEKGVFVITIFKWTKDSKFDQYLSANLSS